MSAQMDLLYLKTTGHVLGGFTRVGEPKKLETTATAFTGDSLLVNGIGDSSVANFNQRPKLIIPGDQIGLFRADLDPGLLAQPRNFGLINRDTVPALQPNSSKRPSATAPPNSTISLPGAEVAARDLQVTVVLEGQSLGDPVVLPPTVIPSTKSSCNVTFPSVAPGTYFLLIFVETYSIEASEFNI